MKLELISAAELERCQDDLELIDAMRKGLAELSTGSVIQPQRAQIADPAANGTLFVMPAISDVAVVKIVSSYPGNHSLGLESHNGLILVLDRKTGIPFAALDGTYITQQRTAAVSAASVSALAPTDAKVLTIMGTGVQARSHHRMVSRVREFSEFRIWGRDSAKAQRLAAELGARTGQAEDMVSGADVICTTTASRKPILKSAWIKSGAHVAAVGWNGRDGGELPPDLLRSHVYVEQAEAALRESGSLIVAGQSEVVEIGHIFSGVLPKAVDHTTVFISVGVAAEDAFASSYYLKKLGLFPR